MIQSALNADIEVVSDLYEAGRRDDGHPFIAERFFVQLTFPNGERFRHYMSWNGCAVSWDYMDGVNHFEDIRPAATAAAERLAGRVRSAGIFDDQHWYEVDPVYGSDAYQSQGIEEQRAYADRFDA